MAPSRAQKSTHKQQSQSSAAPGVVIGLGIIARFRTDSWLAGTPSSIARSGGGGSSGCVAEFTRLPFPPPGRSHGIVGLLS